MENNQQKNVNLLQGYGLAFLAMFLIIFAASYKTRSMPLLGMAELFAFVGIAAMAYAKKKRDGYLFCKH